MIPIFTTNTFKKPVQGKPVFKHFLRQQDSLPFQRGELPLALNKPESASPFDSVQHRTADKH